MKISKESVVYNVSVLSASGVVLQALGFVYQVLISRAAGAKALGLYRLVSPVYAVVMAGTLSGVRLAVTSLSAGLRSRRDSGRIHGLARHSILAFLALFALVGVPVFLLRGFIATRIIGEPRVAGALAALVLCILLCGFEGVLESLFLGLGKTQYTAISNLLEQGVKIPLVLYLVSLAGENPDPVRVCGLIAWGMVLSEIPVLVWLGLAYRRVLGPAPPAREPRAGEKRLRVLPVAAPVCATSVLTNLLSSATVLLLPGRLVLSGLTKDEALSALGVVSEMALPLLTLPMVLIRALANVLLPQISLSVAGGNRADVGRKIEKSFQATGLFVLPATAILVPLAAPLSQMLYRQGLQPAYVLLLAAAVVLTYYEMIAGSILNGLGRQREGMLCMVAGECAQLAATWFLAAQPAFGIYGYLVGILFSSAVVLLLDMGLIFHYTHCLPSFIDSFLLPLTAAGVAGLFARYFYLTALQKTGAVLPSMGAAALLAGGVCAFLLLLADLHPLRYYKTLQPPSRGR